MLQLEKLLLSHGLCMTALTTRIRYETNGFVIYIYIYVYVHITLYITLNECIKGNIILCHKD